jgi:DNA-3-methyladenine glycosylase II
MKKASFTLATVPPYDFDLTAAYATYFKGSYGADSFVHGAFRRLFDLGHALCLATVSSMSGTQSSLLRIDLQGESLSKNVSAEVLRQVSIILGIEQDLAPFYKTASQDTRLAPLVNGLRGLHVPQAPTVFEALVLAILGQQISSGAARALRTSLIRAFGKKSVVESVAYYAFPRAETLSAAGMKRLRSTGLSLRKAEYVLNIARRVARGDLDLEGLRKIPDEEVVRALSEIRGVGKWTANWILIRGLGRADGFPDTDLALLRVLGKLLNRDIPDALEYAARWSPFRSYVTTYLFAAVRCGRFDQLYPR